MDTEAGVRSSYSELNLDCEGVKRQTQNLFGEAEGREQVK